MFDQGFYEKINIFENYQKLFSKGKKKNSSKNLFFEIVFKKNTFRSNLKNLSQYPDRCSKV